MQLYRLLSMCGTGCTCCGPVLWQSKQSLVQEWGMWTAQSCKGVSTCARCFTAHAATARRGEARSAAPATRRPVARRARTSWRWSPGWCARRAPRCGARSRAARARRSRRRLSARRAGTSTSGPGARAVLRHGCFTLRRHVAPVTWHLRLGVSTSRRVRSGSRALRAGPRALHRPVAAED